MIKDTAEIFSNIVNIDTAVLSRSVFVNCEIAQSGFTFAETEGWRMTVPSRLLVHTDTKSTSLGMT